MKSFIQNGIASVPTTTVNFTATGVLIQPPNSGNSRIFITDISTQGNLTLTNASSTTSGSVLVYVAQGNCNYSAPLKVPDGSGVAISSSTVGSVTYFLE